MPWQWLSGKELLALTQTTSGKKTWLEMAKRIERGKETGVERERKESAGFVKANERSSQTTVLFQAMKRTVKRQRREEKGRASLSNRWV